MKNMKKNILMTAILVAAAFGCSSPQQTREYTGYVDTRIGTGGHGHVFVGANVPFGFVQLGPTSIPEEWDWVSGYHESDSTVIGFSHTHLSGTGIGDLFDVTVMPVTGEVTYARGTADDPESGMWSYADRSREVSRPGYYSVPLERYGITAEMTATARVGMHRYTFPEASDAAVIFDLENGGCWDDPVRTEMKAVGNSMIEGCRWSTGWASDQRIYFVAEFSRPFDSFILNGKDDMYGRASFSTSEGEQIMLKVALSPVSVEGARKNLEAELPGWNFEAVADAADAAWNEELSKIKIETADESARKIFYTALYHTMIAPSVFCDVDGSYYGADHQVHGPEGFVNYTTFSLWDTYRAAMPLMTIIHQEKMPDVINTMLNIYSQQGKLPVWHLMGCETDCMVGNPGIMPVADAIIKGFGGFDRELAFEALKESAMLPERGQDLRMKYGYIPCDLFNEAVAYDMEYAIADASVAAAAKALGKDEDYRHFLDRSHSYRNFFDAQTGFMRGRDSKGRFRTPFNPYASTHRADDYCEGNAWQYTWLAPQDFRGLVGCFGSKEAFLAGLDSLFTASSVIEGEASPDISGLMGQYAHGNEPSHHIIYFYTMAGQPWKTADKVRHVLGNLYHDAPDGLSGNEDVGQMSAWYILSSLGFYQVNPAEPRYWFGSPLFVKASVRVPGGEFTIIAEGNSSENKYIQKVYLDGKPYTRPYLEYADIKAGSTLTFIMGSEPAIWYCPDDPQEFASIKSDVEFLKSDAAPRATSTAEAALKVAYGMKEELAQNGESIDRLHEDITALKRSEAGPGRQLVPLVQQNVLKYLESTEVDMFSTKVLFRLPTGNVYDWLGCSGQCIHREGRGLIKILLKEPVQVNGFTFSSVRGWFLKKALIVVGGPACEFEHQEQLKKPKDRTNSVRFDFSPMMVSWVLIEPQKLPKVDSLDFWYNLELHSPDPEYAPGVFTALRKKNAHLQYACNVLVHERHQSTTVVIGLGAALPRFYSTLPETQPWLEVEIVEGRLKATGYTIDVGNDHTKAWTFRGSNDRDAPINQWTILHRYDGGAFGLQYILKETITFCCASSEPMKYFRMVSDPMPKSTRISMYSIEIHGVLCP